MSAAVEGRLRGFGLRLGALALGLLLASAGYIAWLAHTRDAADAEQGPADRPGAPDHGASSKHSDPEGGP